MRPETIAAVLSYLPYVGSSFLLALLLVPLMGPLSYRLGAMDREDARKVHQGNVPRLGGLGIFGAAVPPIVWVMARGPLDERAFDVAGILAASALVLWVGALDDIRGVGIARKLTLETLAAVMVYAWGIRINVLSNPFGEGGVVLGAWALPVTVLWIVVVTNALNLVDGLDGVAAGTGILIAATLLILYVGQGEDVMKLVLAVLIGALLGFLRYNFPPASIFMGDSGSLFLGFFLACFSVLSSQKATAMATMMIPLIAFGHPILDMIYAVLRRYYRGLPLGEADREHIHHKLLEKGLSKRKVVLVIYTVNILLMAGILVLVRRQYKLDLLVLGLLAAGAILGLKALGYIEFIPFFRESARRFALNRRRRYFNYAIRRFASRAAACRTLEEVRPHLAQLMREYDFNRAVISLEGDPPGAPFFLLESRPDDGKVISLEFPVVFGGEPIGQVRLSRDMNEGHLLAVAELARAVSGALGRLTRCAAPRAAGRAPSSGPAPGDTGRERGSASPADPPGQRPHGQEAEADHP